MSELKTISIFRNFIITENFFCINRSNLVNNQFWFLCNVIFYTTSSITLSLIVYDVFVSDEAVSFSLRVFQLYSVCLTSYLANAAKSTACFEIIAKLDETCGHDKDYTLKLKQNISYSLTFLVATIFLDVIGFLILDVKASVLLPCFIAMGAQNAEILLYSLLISVVNLRLSKLDTVFANIGANVYGHILLTSAHLCEEFSIRVSTRTY